LKKLFILCWAFNFVFGLDAEIVSNLPATLHEQMSKADGLTNIQSLINSVNKAQTVQSQLMALKNLNNFSSDPVNATSQVNSVVGNMLNDFNMYSGTSFGNLQELIAGLSSATTTEGMSLKLQQSSATQLQNISVMLQQMEAENQAVLKYKQAEEALKAHQAALSKADDDRVANSLK
jgi:hypothetical protein